MSTSRPSVPLRTTSPTTCRGVVVAEVVAVVVAVVIVGAAVGVSVVGI